MRHSRQSDETFDVISQLIWQHLEDRDWQHNPPRSIAISIVLEASELLEHYQWSDTSAGNKEALAAELADIFIYAFQFAESNDINITDAIRKKLKKSAVKYPADKFKGKELSERSKIWVDTKKRYKKDGL